MTKKRSSEILSIGEAKNSKVGVND